MLFDDWPGIDDCFEPDKEILVIRTAEDVVKALQQHGPETRRRIGDAFQARALRDHTYEQRALQAEHAFLDCKDSKKFAANTKSNEALQEIA
jgi:spore maturation protein CgeB